MSTEGLTAADVPALAERVHAQMVAALREISVPVTSPSEPKPQHIPSEKQSEPPADPTSVQAASVLPVEPGPAQPAPETESEMFSRSESRASTQTSEEAISSPALSSRRFGSEYGTETEEDDGMVLVGRPTQ